MSIESDYHIKAWTNGQHFADNTIKCILLDENNYSFTQI